MVLLWLLMSFALQHIWLEKTGTNAAFYEVTIDSFELDPNYDRTSFVMKSVRVARKGRNDFVISGEYALLRNYGNENTFYYELKNSRGMSLIRGSKPFCEALNSKQAIVRKLREYSTMPPGNCCPLPKGKYEIVNFRVQERDLPLVAVKDSYTVYGKVAAPDGHMMLAFKAQFSIS
ncbi:uncharacterized protein LOC128739284 [Sabethes cyaneus]|uniref:uncharacterized protein LOC128739284 n=1 Tax=Sabethes cyaneus TaxID=53552 RepID=UPI00237DBB74|nr:uncharacterized protein LOC128739284 [Sabethes cyaneus]